MISDLRYRTMAESDSSIWQWCNARRKISKGRRGAIGLASDHAFNQQNESENQKQAVRCDTSSHGSVFPCDSSDECKNSDGQWLPDLVDQPTTPDLDNGPLNTRKLDKSRFNGGTQRGSIASSPSSSACEQVDSSSCASITHDDVVEGMLIQSTDFSSVPSSRNKEMCHEELGSVFQALKHERFELASPEKNLKADHSFRSGRPTLRNLRTVGIRKNKSIVSTSGLDLLVNAIFLLENCYADLMAWGSNDLQVHEQPIIRPFFIHAGLQKKRVIRRAKSAYRHRCNAQESLQSQEPELLKAIDSKPNLKGNHFCELGFGQIAESKQNQCLGDISEFIHEDQAVQSPLTSKLRRSVRGVHAKHYNFVAHPVKTGSIVS